MTREQKDKIFTALEEVRNNYEKECQRRIAEEQGKIIGAYLMAQKFSDILRIEFAVQESEPQEDKE